MTQETGPSDSKKRQPPIILGIGLLLGGLLLAIALNAAYTTWAVNVSQHRWCDTIGLFNEAEHGTQAPTTAYGRQLAADFGNLYLSLGCSK